MDPLIRAKITTITNESGWGVGLEMLHAGQDVPYYTGSYFFKRSARWSATRSIHKTIKRACKFVPPDHKVAFEGTHPTFEHQKCGVLKSAQHVLGEERMILIFHYKNLYGQGRVLAAEAFEHRSKVEQNLSQID